MKRPRTRLGIFGIAAAVCALPLARTAGGVNISRRSGNRTRHRGLATTTSTSRTATATSTSTASASASTSASTTTSVSAYSSATATFTSEGDSVEDPSSSGTQNRYDDDADGGGGGGEEEEDEEDEEEQEDDDATDGYAYRTSVRLGSESDDNTDDQPALSLILVLTPLGGEELVLDEGYEVTWTIDDPEGSDSTLFHVDVYDCGADPLCSGGCGSFLGPLCPEEGCYTKGSTVTIDNEGISIFEAGDGPYFKIAVSPDDGSSYAGCSGSFTLADGGEVGAVEDEEEDVEPESAGSGSNFCDRLDDIPYPLQGNLVFKVAAGVGGISCITPKTVYVGGGTLTFNTLNEAFVFTGVRFVVEDEATLMFSSANATEFNGVYNFQADGGIFNVEEGGTVDMSGRATFRGNSIQANNHSIFHGAVISNQGFVRLRGGASFLDNSVYPFEEDGRIRGGAGDGGAVWNAPTGQLVVDLAMEMEGNGVGAGGNGGGLWNGGYVRFMDDANFAHNEAGSAFVNSRGGKIILHEEMTISDNVSKEEEGSEAGAVWNQDDSVVLCKNSALWQGNRGYNGGAMVNYGKVVFRGEVMVRDNTAVMDGGGFINETGGKLVFYDGAEFISNVGTGYGGAILNHAELDFIADGGVPFNLNFEDNYCGEQECQDIQNKDGSDISGLGAVSDLCEIGNQYVFG
eukprot:jgi/Undpi1/1144/HiC_scaffold_10.g04606.m1